MNVVTAFAALAASNPFAALVLTLLLLGAVWAVAMALDEARGQ